MSCLPQVDAQASDLRQDVDQWTSPTWTPDGRDIVFSSARGGLASLWRISASGGTPRPVAGVGVIALPLPFLLKVISSFIQQSFIKENILRLNLKDEKHSQGPPAVLNIEERAELAAELFSRWEKVCVRIGFGVLGDLGL